MKLESFKVDELFNVQMAKKVIVLAALVSSTLTANVKIATAGDFGIFGKNTIGGAGIGALIGAATTKDAGKGALKGAAIGAVGGVILDNVLPNGGERRTRETSNHRDYDRERELAHAEELRIERERIMQRDREEQRRRDEERALAGRIQESKQREIDLANQLTRQQDYTRQLENQQYETYGYTSASSRGYGR